MKPLQHSFGIREHLLVPFKVAPLKALHPETVKVKHLQRNVPLLKSVDKAVDGRLVVVGRKGRGQPQSEGPFGRHGGTPRQRRILLHDLLRRRAVDHKILQFLVFHRKLNRLHLLAAHLEAHRAGMVDEHPITTVCIVERYVLICDLAGGPAVLVPHVDGLPVFDHRREPLAKAVDQLADAQIQSRDNIIPAVQTVHHSHCLRLYAGNLPVPAEEMHLGISLMDHKRKIAGPETEIIPVPGEFRLFPDLPAKPEGRFCHVISRMILHADAKHVLLRRRDGKGHHADVQGVSPSVDLFVRRICPDSVLAFLHGIKISHIIRSVLIPYKPETLCKFHIFLPFCLIKEPSAQPQCSWNPETPFPFHCRFHPFCGCPPDLSDDPCIPAQETIPPLLYAYPYFQDNS